MKFYQKEYIPSDMINKTVQYQIRRKLRENNQWQQKVCKCISGKIKKKCQWTWSIKKNVVPRNMNSKSLGGNFATHTVYPFSHPPSKHW